MSEQQFLSEVMAELEQIEVNAVWPAIPVRDFDYSAVRKGYEPGAPIGWGSTPHAAMEDLFSQEEE
jgi:hypothetical protein